MLAFSQIHRECPPSQSRSLLFLGSVVLKLVARSFHCTYGSSSIVGFHWDVLIGMAPGMPVKTVPATFWLQGSPVLFPWALRREKKKTTTKKSNPQDPSMGFRKDLPSRDYGK